MEQQLYELPEGWGCPQLGSIARLVGGATPSKKEKKYWDGDIKWASVRDLNVDNLVHTEHRITDEGLASCSTNIIPKGNLVIATRVGLGKVSRAKVDVAINQDLRGVIPNSDIEVDYLFFWFKQKAEFIESCGTGATVKGVKIDFIKSLKIPLPVLNEQKRIVAKLDALFTRIDTAITQLQQTLELSKALFASALDEAFKKNPEWEPMKIKDVFNVINGRAYKKPELLESGKYRVVRIQNLKGGQTYYYSDLELNEDKYCNQNDLLFSWSGTPGTSFGAFVWEGGKSIFHYHIWNMKPFIKINDRFSYWLLRDLTEEAIESSRGVAGMLHITKGMMESFDIEIPPIEDQTRIASNLDNLSKHTRSLETATQEKLNDLTTLKASLLDAAFKGQL